MGRRKKIRAEDTTCTVLESIPPLDDPVYDVFKNKVLEPVVNNESEPMDHLDLDIDSFENYDESKLVKWTSKDKKSGCTGKLGE